MTTAHLRFIAPTRPLSVNEGGHWAAKRRRLEPWKDAAWATARNWRVQAPGFTPVPITVQVVLPFRKAGRRDAHNYTGTVVKAVVDGIVRAGLVPDDTPEWVTVLDSEFAVIPQPKPLFAIVRIRPRETP